MTETPDRADVLRLALDIIKDRGWASVWSTGDDGPLNIRCAIAKAATQLVGHCFARIWYDLYLDAVHAVAVHLKDGIINWEGDVREPEKVEAMLTEVINRLENDDISPRQSRQRRISGV